MLAIFASVHASEGPRRMAIGVVATLLTIALAQWGIVSANLSGMMGLPVFDTAMRLGPSLAWTLAKMANTTFDLIWLAIGVVVAAIASR